jgi:O-antigen/teichoic acid export membrane protein
MPKSEFGEFNYLLSALLVLPVIMTLGLHVPLIRISCSSDDVIYKKRIFSSTIIFSAVLILIITILTGITGFYEFIARSIFYIEKDILIKSLLSAIIVLFSSLNLLVYSLLIIKNDVKKIGIYNILKFINLNILSFIALLIFTNIDTSASRLIGLAVSEIILFIIGILFFSKGYLLINFNHNYILNAFKMGLPLVPGTIATFITLLSDRFFLSKYFDISYVAEYGLAMMFLVPIQMIMASAQTSMAPDIYSIKEKNAAHEKSTLFFIQLLLIYLALIFLIYLFLNFALYFAVIPNDYQNTSWLVLILSVGVMGSVLLQIPFNYFIYMNKSIYIFYISSLAALITVIGGYYSIPRYGFIGAALTSGIANLLMLFIAFKLTVKLKQSN